MVLDTMDTSSPYEENFLESLEVSSSTASSINVKWSMGKTIYPFIDAFRVHYQKIASTYVQYGPRLAPNQKEFEIENLVADTYYKVCLVVYRNDTNPLRECVDASTTNWQLPVSIGSSIGAILALSMIVLIVLLSRCQIPYRYRKRKAKNASKYDTMSSNFHEDHYDFSETATHGNDDDYPSEMEQSEYGLYDPHGVTRHKHVTSDRSILPNGLPRNHVHPHNTGEHRNSLGRINLHGNGPYHYQRPNRSYSIQADGPSLLLSNPGKPTTRNHRKLSMLATKEWHSIDEPYSRAHAHPHVSNLRRTQNNTSSVPSDFFRHSGAKHKSDMTTVCSPATAQGFSFFEEQNETLSKTSAQSRTSKEVLTGRDSVLESGRDSVLESTTLYSDAPCDDMGQLGAVGGFVCDSVDEDLTRQWESRKSIEMELKNSKLSLVKGESFDEHTV